MLADIDFFKRVNDLWGHPGGDEVLRQVAGALRRALRPSDTLARFGGEEFAVLLQEENLARATNVAERLRAGVAALSRLPGNTRITISVGVAASLPDETPEELIARCDQALYRSKREGRDRVSVAADAISGDPASAPLSPRLVQSTETQRPG
jgi:diguanylate cyclase (GGDEF)-like protein